MRMSMIAATALALFAADAASAQRMVTPGPGTYPGPGRAPGGRWGSQVGGHWWGGVNAPGGWRAYRRPARGWSLPGYWIAPSFAIADWATYGLGAPPAGYGWTRYYDDAVLIDGNGRVYDSVDGIDWSRGDYAGYADGGAGGGYQTTYSSNAGYAAPGYVQPTYGQSTYSPAPAYAPGAGYSPPAYAERRNSGIGGAVVGAGVGAIAGTAIGGRGHRVEGALIGAGVGGVAGYAIDRSSTRRAPREGYGYPPPPPAYGAGYAPPPPPPGPATVWHSPDGGTTITTTSVGGYAGGSTTVVTVQTAPVVTTTTTEIVEDHVTWTRKHRRPAPHKWVRRTACGC